MLAAVHKVETQWFATIMATVVLTNSVVIGTQTAQMFLWPLLIGSRMQWVLGHAKHRPTGAEMFAAKPFLQNAQEVLQQYINVCDQGHIH